MKEFWKENRIGILGTIIIHLVIVLLLLVFKMSTIQHHINGNVVLDFKSDQEILEELERRLLVEKRMEQELLQQLSNNAATSNKPHNTAEKSEKQQLIDNARKEMYGDDYEEIKLDQTEPDDEGFNVVEEEKDKKEDEVIESNNNDKTTITYNLEGRSQKRMPVPVYQCEGGGAVIVNISVNREGYVVSATISEKSSDDECLHDAALISARSSRFTTKFDAPIRQKGTITYTFIAQ